MADWDGGAALDIVGAGTVARAGNSSDSRIDVVAKLGIMPYSLFRSFGNNPFLWKLCWQFFFTEVAFRFVPSVHQKTTSSQTGRW